MLAMGGVSAFASPDGPGAQPMQHRVWETEPAGWYRFAGSSGRTTILFTLPGHYMRPAMVTNVFTRDGDRVDSNVIPRFDAAVFDEREWDPEPALEYFQIFRATGRSVTQVGFKLADDGVDGGGPGSQDVTVSIHRAGAGPPSAWKQVGPAMPVPGVDTGGPKSYAYSACWNSGEVPTIPGQLYAVRLRPAKTVGHFQAFWRASSTKDSECYRVSAAGCARVERSLWMSVAGDNDGLLVPYNKRIHTPYRGETQFARKWSQTYVAQGRSLAGVALYTMFSGVQPGLTRQRAVVRIRKGGPAGPVVGTEKIAIGSGNYTGDASWGLLGCAYSPGEVPLEPGKTYAVEFESIENSFTLRGFVNIKGMPSDEKPGFHPYPKAPGDDYPDGAAYLDGKTEIPRDLDMQVIEYQNALPDWENAVDRRNLIADGGMDGSEMWKPFRVDPGTALERVKDENDAANSVARVIGGGPTGKAADGGYVQKIAGLSHEQTYRLSGRLRCTWAVDLAHECRIGLDPTGQDTDPLAATIVWSKPTPPAAGIWTEVNMEPLRPAADAVSVWLRAKTNLTQDFVFKADTDDIRLHRVTTAIPRQ